MANGRYKGAIPEERLSINTLLDADMLQVRHRIGQDGDSDKGVSKAVLQGIPLAVCENLPTVASKYAVLQNCPDFTLVAGRSVLVYFRYGNTAENPTLNIAGTGDIPMDSTVGLPSWKAETWQMFTYATATVNGVVKNNWVLIQGAIEREIKNITNFLLDGSFFPRILGNGYENMSGIESDDYFYCLGYYDKKENTKWKVKEDNGKVFIKSNFGFFSFVSHHYYRTKFDDMIDYDYDNVPLVCLYPQIFTKQTALSLGIQPYEQGELKSFSFYENSELILVRIGNEYAKSIDNGASWTKVNGPSADITDVFYESGNIFIRGRTPASCGTIDSEGNFTPIETPVSQIEMSRWINKDFAVRSDGRLINGFDGSYTAYPILGYTDGMDIKVFKIDDTHENIAYISLENGNYIVHYYNVIKISDDWGINGAMQTHTFTFTFDGDNANCYKLLIDFDSYGNVIIMAIIEQNNNYHLLKGSTQGIAFSTSSIEIPLSYVYNYEQKITSDMSMKVNPSKMSFSMIGNKPFICTAKKSSTQLERFVISKDSSDNKLIACSCGFVCFDYDDSWNNKYEYDDINMNLYRMSPCLDYLDYNNYIREHKYDEFTEQKSEIIPISPPEEQYASAGDDCDCFIRLV